jgi:23S rRNA A1618 N6-methylase RlmF
MNNLNKLYRKDKDNNNKIFNSTIQPHFDEEFDFALCHGPYLC